MSKEMMPDSAQQPANQQEGANISPSSQEQIISTPTGPAPIISITFDSRQSQAIDRQMASIADAVYNPSQQKAGNWTRVSGQDLEKRGFLPGDFSDEKSGFKAGLYTDGNGHFVLGFAGTDDKSPNAWPDRKTDLEQAVVGLKAAVVRLKAIADGVVDGQTRAADTEAGIVIVEDAREFRDKPVDTVAQYREAAQLARHAQSLLGDQLVGFTGHSLGGGLAALASAVTDKQAVTFNPVGLADQTYKNEGIKNPIKARQDAEQLIKKYVIDYEPVNTVQDHSPLPRAPGHKIELHDPRPLPQIELGLYPQLQPELFPQPKLSLPPELSRKPDLALDLALLGLKVASDEKRLHSISNVESVMDETHPWTATQHAEQQKGSGPAEPKTTQGWLLPPYVDPSGQRRDSLGRDTSPGEVAAAMAADKAVQRERDARWSYLQGAYRDPHAARAALDDLVKQQGWTSAAARVAREPGQFGELRGEEGLFAGAKARAERDAAQRAAGAIGPGLERIGAAEAQAERGYRAGVEAQRVADATGIPRLSAAAEAAIGAVAAAKDDRTRSEAWRAVQGDKQVAGELRAFGAAVEQRFGEEGVRALLRAGERPCAVAAASVAPDQRPALDRVAGLTAALKAGERAGAMAAQRKAESERQGQHRGLHI